MNWVKARSLFWASYIYSVTQALGPASAALPGSLAGNLIGSGTARAELDAHVRCGVTGDSLASYTTT